MTKSLSAHRRTNRPGLTLVEVLVIVSILGMLTAIALPAVNRARESGRRNTCTNNFHQFGTALIAFEATHGVYPSANSNGPYFRETPKRRITIFIAPHVFLLPHLDLNDLYQSFEIPKLAETTPYTPANYFTITNTTQRVALFRCPSDPDDPTDAYLEQLYPGNNIRVCFGIYDWDVKETGNHIGPGKTAGPFIADYFYGSAHVIDGVSRTVAASEKLLGSGVDGTFDRRRDWWFAAIPFDVTDPDQMVGFCGNLTVPDPICFLKSGTAWSRAGFEQTWYNHATTPNAKIPDCTYLSSTSSSFNVSDTHWIHGGSYRATSNHPGGVNVVFLDGHTEFVIDDVELPIWRALGTIAGAD